MHDGHWNLLRTPPRAVVRLRGAGGAARARRFSQPGLDRDGVALLPHPLRRPRPGQPARHHHPDVAAARRPGAAPSRSSPSSRAPRPGSAPWAAPPWSSTSSTASWCSARSSPASRAWAADHWPFSLVLITVVAAALALFLAWRPVSTRLNVFVDPIGSVHSTAESVEIGPPARRDRVERHLVEHPAPADAWARGRRGGRGTTSPPRRVAGRWCGSCCRPSSRPVSACPSSWVRSVSVVAGGDVHRGAEGEVDPPPAGPGRAAAPGHRRRRSAGSPRWRPARRGAPVSRASDDRAAHQRPHGVGVARSRPRGTRTPPRPRSSSRRARR